MATDAHGEAFALAKAEMLARNPKLREETIDLDGSTQNAVCHAIAVCNDEFVARNARELEGLYLDTAAGDMLTRLVADRYGVQRKGTTAARVSLTFSRTGTAEVEVPAGTVCSTADGIRFATDEAFTWAALDVSDVVADATAVTVGPETNVAAGTVTAIETALDDGTITVTNPAAAAGGNDDETDEELKARVRDVRARLGRGIAESIRLSALEVDRVREAAVYEAVDDEGNPIGGGTLVIADASGASNQALIDEVEAKIVDARPLGAYVDVLGAVVREESIAVTATWDPGQATAANVSALRSAIAARVNQLDPRAAPVDATPDDACLLRAEVVTEVRPLVPGLKRLVVTVPAGTVEPDPGQVIRTSVALVTVT